MPLDNVINVKTDGSEEIRSPWWSLALAGGTITSLRYDPTGTGQYGTELIYRPLVLRCGEQQVAITASGIVLSSDGTCLDISVPDSDDGQSTLDWAIDASLSGYYDRLSAKTYGAAEYEVPALTRFIAGATGHMVLIETLKRLDPDVIASVDYLHPANSSGRTVIIQTVDRSQFVLDHGSNGRIRFGMKDGHLSATVTIKGGHLVLKPYSDTEPIELENGERLPYFTFGSDTPIVNSVGGKTSLNRLLNEFYMQSAFWFHCPTGIGYHGEWGPMGHAYVNCAYREGVRRTITGQVLADDGYGRDGLAYIWGDNRGWPFPDQKQYDTRHLNSNAIHICGIRHYLMWTGEYEKIASRDFSIRGLCKGDMVFTQDERDAPMLLAGDLTYAQSFRSDAGFDTISLNLTVPYEDPVLSQAGVATYECYPRGRQDTPLIVDEVPDKTVAQLITPSRPFNMVGIQMAVWVMPGNGGRLRAFIWIGDYESTLGQTPLFECRVSEFIDNETAYLPMPRMMPAGTEILVVLDEPTQMDATQPLKTTCWYTETHLSDELGPSFIGGEPLAHRQLRAVYGIRHRPGGFLTLSDSDGQVVLKKDVEFPVIDGYWDLPLEQELPAGSYTLELKPSGARMYWKASALKTDFAGEAYMNGQSWDCLSRARRMMDYQMEHLHGEKEGVLRIDEACGDTDHLGISYESVGNNYYDIIPFGYYDAYAGACFYRSLAAMADLERAYGDASKAGEYERFMERVRSRYNGLYWTDDGYKDGASRYIGCIDVNGNKRDYGFTVLNTMAITSGLAPQDHAEAILDWLDNGKTLNHEGKWNKDIYQFGFAPRFNTIYNPDWWSVGWNVELCPWGDQIQNGGADLYESYYDLTARLKTRGADDAYRRFLEILKRYAEPDRLTGGRPLFTGESVQGGCAGGPGGVGVMTSEFPETSLLASILVYGFLGAEARSDGLHIKPCVPSDQPFIRGENIYYHGTYLDIEASASSIKIRMTPVESKYDFKIDGKVMHPPFEWEYSLQGRSEVVIVPVSTKHKRNEGG